MSSSTRTAIMRRPTAFVVVVMLAIGSLCHARVPGGFLNNVIEQAVEDIDNRSSYMEVLDEDARIFVWRRFLTPEECDHIREKAVGRLERSGVVETETGSSKVDSIRTSDGMFFDRAEDPVIRAIEKRLAAWTLLPVHYGEGLQVLRYKKSQKYDAHFDYFFHKEGTTNGGNRYATVLMYLSDWDEGGETVFPKLRAPPNRPGNWSECAQPYVAVKPNKGDAILFHSMKPNGELEERSMHGACPVISGEKWSMTKWYHAMHYNMGDVYDEHYQRYLQAHGEHSSSPQS